MKNFLFLHATEKDKLNFFGELAIQVNKTGANVYMCAFSRLEKAYYNKKGIKNIIFIPKLLKEKSKNLKEYQKFTAEELDDMFKFTFDYNKINKNKVNVEKYRIITKSFLEVLKVLKNKYDINNIVMWNHTFLFDRIGWYFSMKENLNNYIFEQGLFRPFTITLDNKAVNFGNSVPTNKEFYKKIEFDENRYNEFIEKPEKINMNKNLSSKKENYLKKIIYEVIDDINASILKKEFKCSIYNKNILGRILRNIFNNKNNEDEFNDKIPENYIFIPFQVKHDSQILLNSPNFKNMEELVDIVSRISVEINNRIENKVYFIFKEHPADTYSYNKLYEKYKENKYMIFLKKFDTNKLIKDSKAILTINSTVGIEGLIKGKKVITLGEAFYNIDGIVKHCDNPECLDSVVEEVLKTDVDLSLIKRFLYYLRFTYQKEIYWRDPNEDDVMMLVNIMINNNM